MANAFKENKSVICDTHILAFNESEIIQFTIRHYKTFCTRIARSHGAEGCD